MEMIALRRTSLLLRCSPEEAAKVRHHAALEHRSVAGYLLFVLERNLAIEEKYSDAYTPLMIQQSQEEPTGREDRTAIHLRCSVEQANRIRKAAARRQLSISKFIVFALQRSWRAFERVQRDRPHRPWY
jgi:uncharacterized protein (DUF1778 family)